MVKNILFIYRSLEKKLKLEVVFLILFMLISNIAELFSILIFIPYISLLQNNQNNVNQYFAELIGDLTISRLTFFMIFITLIAGFIRLVSLRWSTSVAYKISCEIVFKAYNSILNKDYTFHLNESKNKLISIIHSNGSKLFYETLNPIFILLNSLLFLTMIISALFLYDWKSLFSVVFIFAVFYFFLSKRAKNILKVQSHKQVLLSKLSLERLDTELSSIEYILLGNFQNIFSKNFKKIDSEYKMSQVIAFRTALTPRILIEYFCLMMLVFITFYLSIKGNIDASIPLLAGIALAIQKVFPYAQRGFESWANLSTSKEGLSSLINYMSTNKLKEKENEDDPIHENISFKSIEFINVYFSYKNNQEILNNVNFKINKGDKLAIVGPSGCGKSTFLRLSCGLLNPSKGEIKLNGESLHNNNIDSYLIKNWMRSIGYVPQKINLTGKTLRENIIFGAKKKDGNFLEIEEIVDITCLNKLVSRCKGLDNEIFQNQFSLSGGESQRLAIARALYRNSKILFMDEPTSSLDPVSQDIILKNLMSIKNMTCILITHRMENMKYFDRVIQIKNKNIIEISEK